jgi:capsid assembly protease
MSMRAIIEAMAAQAWAMKPDYLAQVAGVVMARHLLVQDVGHQRASPLASPLASLETESHDKPKRPLYEMQSGVAVVRVWGSLHKYATLMDTTSFAEGVSYQQVAKALKAAADDASVRAIVLHIHSPGGQVEGLDTLASIIAGVRAKKPVHAYIEDLGASAAYWMASQCQSITANPAAMVGSIGVYTVVFDTAKMYELAGIRSHLIKAGASKGIGAPGVAISEQDLVSIQQDIDGFGAIFRDAVVRGRPSLKGTIATLADGRTHLANVAKEKGLIDRVAHWESFLGGLVSRHGGRSERAGAVAGPGAGAAGAGAMVRIVA